MKRILVVAAVVALLAGCTSKPNILHYGRSYKEPDPVVIKIPTESQIARWSTPVDGNYIVNKIKGNPIKGLNESKSEYLKRAKGIDNLIFISSGLAEIGYDPETEKVKISSYYRSALGLVFMDGYKGEYTGKYIGTNAYGATREVQKKESTIYNIIFKDQDEDYRVVAFLEFDGDCKVAPADYRKIKDDLKVQFIAKLRDPFIELDYSGSKVATISDPYDEFVTNYTFYADLIAARIINTQTNQPLPCKLQYRIQDTRQVLAF